MISTTLDRISGTTKKQENQDSPEHQEASQPETEKLEKMQNELRKLASILRQVKHSETKPSIDRSDVGSSKKPRLSSSKRTWSLKRRGLYDNGDDDFKNYDDNDSHVEYDSPDDLFDDSILSRYLHHSSAPTSVPPSDCDCGYPWRKSGGVHVCRYFGTFQCDCVHRWTSAYCWKGEQQGCRACNKQSLPVETRQLETRPSADPSGGHHDSSRCSRCRKLGYDCSL